MLEENEEVFELLCLCARQVRVGFGGLVGFDMPAVFAVADRLGMEIGRHEIEKIRAVEIAMTSTERSTEHGL
ncbi:DUF1799 domain-containing protein [Maridesulfovibrio sp.]|uniref:DUF1799 domain-containing protein n=1 Tax=Maridesulfovibrio sp. TaxID=2795000 RepID=UPI0029CAA516|nr:DUF1799 domain-containing protein [Maridesulfovibrio sp.]